MPIISNFPSGGAKKSLLQFKEVMPAKENQTVVPDEGYDGLSTVEVSAIPDEYADVSGVTTSAENVLEGDKFVGSDGFLHDGAMPDNEDVNVTLDTENTEYVIPEGKHSGDGMVQILLQEQSATPNASEQIITPDSGKVLSKVTIAAIDPNLIDTSDANATASTMLSGYTAYVSGEKVTGNIATKTSSDLTLSGSSIIVPAGYYASQASRSVSAGTLSTPSISVNSSGLITATGGVSASGYISSGTTKEGTSQLSTQAGGTYTLNPGESVSRSAGTYLTSALSVTAAAASSGGGYIGDEITGTNEDSGTLTIPVDTTNLIGFVLMFKYAMPSNDTVERLSVLFVNRSANKRYWTAVWENDYEDAMTELFNYGIILEFESYSITIETGVSQSATGDDQAVDAKLPTENYTFIPIYSN